MTVGKVVSQRNKMSWWESRALYGWTVLVPRTKEQAGEMSDRLVTHGAIPMEVPTIAVEPPRSPAQMERAVKGLVDGRYQWVVFTSTNAVRAVWEKFEAFGLDARAFSGVKIACVGQATADKVRSFGIIPELVPSGEQSSEGLLAEFAPYDDVFDPVNRVLLPRADIATETLAEGLRERGWEIDDVTAYRTVRAAPPPAIDPRDDQDRRVRRGVLHLVVHGPQPRGYCRKAARAHHRCVHRTEDGRDRDRVRPARGRAARDRSGGTAGRGPGRARGPVARRRCAASAAEEVPRPPLIPVRRGVSPGR